MFLVHHYLVKHVRFAQMVFDQMPNLDFYVWKVMIRWYFLNDLFVDVIPFYNHMRMSFRECDNIFFFQLF